MTKYSIECMTIFDHLVSSIIKPTLNLLPQEFVNGTPPTQAHLFTKTFIKPTTKNFCNAYFLNVTAGVDDSPEMYLHRISIASFRSVISEFTYYQNLKIGFL